MHATGDTEEIKQKSTPSRYSPSAPSVSGALMIFLKCEIFR